MEEDTFDFYQELKEQFEDDSDSYDDESASYELDTYDP